MRPHISRSGAGSAVAVLALLAACSETPTAPPTRQVAPQSANFSDAPVNPEGNGPSILHTVQWYDQDRQEYASRNAVSNLPILYHGGPILQNHTSVAAVYWSKSQIYKNAPALGTHGPGAADNSLIGYFLSHLGGSPYFNINTTYFNATGAHVVNAVSYTQYWANNVNAPGETQSVSDAQMLAMLQSGFNSGALTYDASTVYAIFTSGKVNLGGGFGTQYCAYHWYGTVTINGASKTVLYAAMPYDYAYPSACTAGTKPANGSLDPGADYEVNTLAHEVEETTTDMLGTAWWDARGFENADKCAWLFGTAYIDALGGVANIKVGSKDFLVQQNWLQTGGCALSH